MVYPNEQVSKRYGFTLALIFIVALIRCSMTPWLGNELPFAIFVVPLVVSAYFWGAGPALLVTLSGGALGMVIVEEGRGDVFPLAGRAAIWFTVGLSFTTVAWLLSKSKEMTVVANQRVIEANKQKDRFLAVLGHELRNPLSGIVLGAEIMVRRAGHDPQALQLPEMVLRQAKHMQRLIDELLDISRIEQGKIQLVLSEVSLQDVIKTCAEQQTGYMTNRHQTLTLNVPQEPVLVKGDRDRLMQVVANLLTNAGKYSGSGSHIEVHLSNQQRHAVIAVKDNGKGIPSDKLPQLFEPFMQVDPGSFDSKGGLGLGLPMVKSLVELHGGSVTASSPGEGFGAVFTVLLPMLGPSPTALQAHATTQGVMDSQAGS